MELALASIALWMGISLLSLIVNITRRDRKGVRESLYYLLVPVVFIFNGGMGIVLALLVPIIMATDYDNAAWYLTIPVGIWLWYHLAKGVHWLHEKLRQ